MINKQENMNICDNDNDNNDNNLLSTHSEVKW